MTRDEQPSELGDYLEEAEAVVTEWYSRDGLEESHDRNIDALAHLMCLNVVMGKAVTFAEMTQAARLYLIAAFQMGRGAT